MAHLDLQTGTYEAAAALLHGRESRRIGHNTRLEKRSDGTLAVVYHSTAIYELRQDGWSIIRTAGWDTVTTWSRINSLIPGRMGVWSRRGARNLHAQGHAITPFVDGLAIHADGRIGFDNGAGVDVILTPDDVDAIIAADEKVQDARAVKRSERLLREHPAVNAPRSHRGYDQRSYDCGRCAVELDAERTARRAILAAEHAAMAANLDDVTTWTTAELDAAGSHVQRDIVDAWPRRADGTVDYSATPTYSPTVRIVCPWDCPSR